MVLSFQNYESRLVFAPSHVIVSRHLELFSERNLRRSATPTVVVSRRSLLSRYPRKAWEGVCEIMHYRRVSLGDVTAYGRVQV